MIGKTDLEIYGDFEHVRQYIEDDKTALKLKKGETLVKEQVFIYPGGEKIHTLTKKFPVHDENDNLIAIASIARNITVREKAEMDKFFSIIAHDLRNPFNSILGFSELLLKHYDTYDGDEVLTFIRMINEASRQSHNLLENLLHWSRSQTGRIQFEPTGIDVSTIVDSAFKLYEANSSEKNQEIINKVKKETLVYGDVNMVSTIIRNLVSNAVKFTRPGGKVTVSAKNRGNMIDIMVEDTGIGIPPDIIEKLFHIDESVLRSGTANEEGTGLGLILCQEFALKNHGNIQVSSREEKGTTFTLSLPRIKKSK